MKSVNHMVVYHLAMETKNCLYNGSCEYLESCLRSNPKKNKIITRTETKGDLYVPQKMGNGDWLYHACKVWNSIPHGIRDKFQEAKKNVAELRKNWHTLMAMELDRNAECEFRKDVLMWLDKHIPT